MDSPQNARDRLLREGKTVWRLREAPRAGVLLDGAAYFGALRAALLEARRSVMILGWDIDSRVRLRGTDPVEDGAPEAFRDFLEYLVERRRELEVRLLLWDYSILYALEREPLPALNLDWRTPSRVIVALDDALPAGASHHQKLVVIDDVLAFCGGIDITVNRWDTADHEPHQPERKGPSGDPYGPFHDVQMIVDGAAATALGDLARLRWARATDDRIAPIRGADPVWPDAAGADFESVQIGIARTMPADEDEPAITEIRDLYLESIRRAERYVYIENQYLTVDEIAEALTERLSQVRDLEALIITPRRPQGWLETKTMGVGQARFMARLEKSELGERVRFCYPYSGDGDDETAVMVHAKLMIVDDTLLRVGSSNLNQRSMGLDSECDLAVEAEDETRRRQVRAVLARLLAHHTGRSPDEVAERLSADPSLVGAVDALNRPGRGLRKLAPASEYEDALADTLIAVADREAPLKPGEVMGDMFAAVPRRGALRRGLRLAGAALLLAILVVLWKYTPLADWTDPEKIAGALETFRANRLAVPILLGAFLVGGIVLFPLTALVTVTGMVLGPWAGFACALVGSLASAAAGYGIGHVAGKRALSHLLGRRFRKIRRAVTRRGILAVAVIRMVPVAPYTLVNVVLGAVGVGIWPFLAGTLMGLLPGVLALTVLGDRLLQAWRDPEPANVAWFVAAIVAWLALALGLQRLSARLKEDES